MAQVAALAEAYFSSLSPTAARIHCDVAQARAAYGALWSSLEERERAEIADSCIIKPEVALKYALLDRDAPESPICDNLLGYFDLGRSSRVVSDGGARYRDEHGGPYSAHSRSQLELCELGRRAPAPAPRERPGHKEELEASHFNVLRELKSALGAEPPAQETSLKPSKVATVTGDSFMSRMMGAVKPRGSSEERERLVTSAGRPHQIVASSDNHFKTNFKSNASTVDDGPEESMALLSLTGGRVCATERDGGASDDDGGLALPKTGLDFLDNW